MFLTQITDSSIDDYHAHQIVKSMFSGSTKALFQRTPGGKLMILSEKGCSISRDVSDQISSIQAGDKMIFSARLNSIAKNYNRDDVLRNAPSLVPVRPRVMKDWIANKFNAAGFTSDFTHTLEGLRISQNGHMRINAMSVFVVGKLKVIDADVFKASVINGIGRAKYLGFGLLNIFSVLDDL